MCKRLKADIRKTYDEDSKKSESEEECWLINFEETAELCQWTKAQKVIYAKRLLSGSAKLFANFECTAKSWKILKKSLVAEFSTTVIQYKEEIVSIVEVQIT